jgi:transporter family-2 protein
MGSLQSWVPVLFGTGAGVSFVIQQAVNARLRTDLGSPWWAGFVSYAGGTLVMAIAILVLRERWVLAEAALRAPWWAWTGGFFGAVYIAVSIVLVPRLGTATVVALIVTGQMASSLAFDNFGLFGVPRVPIDLSRVLAAAFLVTGVVLIRR